jgi:hypothetical protein
MFFNPPGPLFKGEFAPKGFSVLVLPFAALISTFFYNTTITIQYIKLHLSLKQPTWLTFPLAKGARGI